MIYFINFLKLTRGNNPNFSPDFLQPSALPQINNGRPLRRERKKVSSPLVRVSAALILCILLQRSVCNGEYCSFACPFMF